jgi:hypothetical protein
MRTSLVAAVLCVILAFPGGCQTAAKKWTDNAEFDLYARIASESNAREKLKLLLEWRRLYPTSDLTLVRQSLLLSAYDSAGLGDEAFAVASELLEADPSNVMAQYLLCSWAPRLKAPPEGAARLVKKTATEVLARLDQILPASDTRREMSSFLDGIETGKPARTKQVSPPERKEQRARVEQVARQALNWANAR